MNKSLVVLGLILSIMLLDLSAFASSKANGEKTYTDKCFNCHSPGNSKHGAAPKLGDKEIWAPLLEKGLDALVTFVLRDEYHPRCKACRTSDVIEAVKYMANNSNTGGNYVLW